MSNTLQPPTKRSAQTALNPDDTEDESSFDTPSTASSSSGLVPTTASGGSVDFDEDVFDVTLDDLDDLDDTSIPTTTSAPAPKKKKLKTAANPDAPKRVRKPKAAPKPPEPKAYAPKPAFAETIDHLAHMRECPPCPLCQSEVKVMWFSTVMHLQVCANDKCWYPFNLKGNDYWSKFGGLTTATTRNKFVPVYRKHAASLPPPAPEPVAAAPVRLLPVRAAAHPPPRRPTAIGTTAPSVTRAAAQFQSQPFAPTTHPAAAAAAAAMMASVQAAGKAVPPSKPVASTTGTPRSAATLAAARKLAGATVTAAGKTRAATKSVSPSSAGGRTASARSKSASPAASSGLRASVTAGAATTSTAPSQQQQQQSQAPTPEPALTCLPPLPIAPQPAVHHDHDPLAFLFGDVGGAPSTATGAAQHQLPTPVVSPNAQAAAPPDDLGAQAMLDAILGSACDGAAGGPDAQPPVDLAFLDFDAFLGMGV